MILGVEWESVGVTFLASPKRSAFRGFLIFGEEVLHLKNHVVEVLLEKLTGFDDAEFEALVLSNLIDKLDLFQFAQKFVGFALQFLLYLVNKSKNII